MTKKISELEKRISEIEHETRLYQLRTRSKIKKLETDLDNTNRTLALIFDKVYLTTNENYAERLALVLKEIKNIEG